MKCGDLSILLVDDDEVDVLTLKDAFDENDMQNRVYQACDGVEALAMLRGEGDLQPLPWPLLILLDLNMPRMNGIEFLQALRADPQLHQSVVFVLTTSMSERDLEQAYQQHIAGYTVKSNTGESFTDLVRLIKAYRAVVQFPKALP